MVHTKIAALPNRFSLHTRRGQRIAVWPLREVQPLGFLKRLFRSEPGHLEINATARPTGLVMTEGGPVTSPATADLRPSPFAERIIAPTLPHFEKKELPPKDQRPYKSTDCPYCATAIAPPPRGKRACPHCHETILVRTSHDGTMFLLRTTDLQSWSEWDDGVRRAAFEEGLAGERAALRAAGFLVGEEGWSVEIVGESHYQAAIERIIGGTSHRHYAARLVRDSANPRDSSAVRLDVQGQTVGYVSRDETDDVQPLLQKLDAMGRPAWVRATFTGGGGHYSYGVEIDDLPDEDAI